MIPIEIGSRQIGPGYPCYLIAELSANHGQRLEVAMDLIRAAKEAGADAVKLQTYRPDTMTLDSNRPEFLIGEGTQWSGRKLYDLYSEAFTPWEWHAPLKDLANQLEMDLFSTPFDDTAVEFLESLGVPAYKIASFELVDLPLIRLVAATGKPIIMSTGMATEMEIQEAIVTARSAGASQIALLKCNSAYPASLEEMNLRSMPALSERHNVVVGLSDHTLDPLVTTTAIALGASLIEKHFTLRRKDGGPDAAFSLEPAEFSHMVKAVRDTEAALGTIHFGPTERERPSTAFRRSLFAVADIRKGETFTHLNVRCIRPSYGLHPRYLQDILGGTATMDILRGTPLAWDLISKD